MTPKAHKLTAADRAELCRRVDLPALLTAAGVAVRRNGASFLCALRDEKTPSCHLYPPGVGRKGADGWTLKDYGDGWGGDALAYLVDKQGLAFVDAVAELCRVTGWTPAGWDQGRPAGSAPPRVPCPAPPPTRAPAGPTITMTPEAQRDAARAFVSALLDLVPAAGLHGEDFLTLRGCFPVGGAVGCWVLPAEACKPLAARLAAGPEADLLTRAGLLKPAADGKPPRLPWWDRVAVLGCKDEAGRLTYLLGRRLDWTAGDRWGKYINQATAGGTVRWPFNLCALYQAAGRRRWPVEPDQTKAGEVLLVEGPLDALGAACLGWPAVALLTRLQAHDYADHDGAAARMLEAHLPALRDVRRVLVVPDADPGTKGEEGEAMAARLAAWLRFAGARAGVARLVDLCPNAPKDCKDLADLSKAIAPPF